MEVTNLATNKNNNEQISSDFLNKLEQQKYWDIVNLIAKMVVDVTLLQDDEESNSLPPVQQ
jgi:hypothetical protein